MQTGKIPWTDRVQLLSCIVPLATALLLPLNLAWLAPADTLFATLPIPRLLAVLLFGFIPAAVLLWYVWRHDWTFLVQAAGASLAARLLAPPLPTAETVSSVHRLAPWALCASIACQMLIAYHLSFRSYVTPGRIVVGTGDIWRSNSYTWREVSAIVEKCDRNRSGQPDRSFELQLSDGTVVSSLWGNRDDREVSRMAGFLRDHQRDPFLARISVQYVNLAGSICSESLGVSPASQGPAD